MFFSNSIKVSIQFQLFGGYVVDEENSCISHSEENIEQNVLFFIIWNQISRNSKVRSISHLKFPLAPRSSIGFFVNMIEVLVLEIEGSFLCL